MKRLIKPIVIVLFFGAMAAYGSYSFFSDKETSTGNAFAAGKLDLIVNVDNNPLTNGIFNLPDMKPGDKDEKTVKIKVDDNPACGSVKINLTSDLDNSCTGPELKDEPGCTPSGAGELNDNLNFGIWADVNCNNVFDSGEQFLTQGTLTGNVEYHIGELGTTEKCYGVQWCYGTMTVNETTHTITCDGSTLNNASQTDSFTADLIVTALQKRNQFDSGCPVDGAGNGNNPPATCTPTSPTEICGNGTDDNCNGLIDEGCLGINCATMNCSDGNSCTTDSCNPITGCAHSNATDGTTCNDSNACTFGDVCITGVCRGFPDNGCFNQCTTNANCNDNNACTTDTCSGSPITSCSHTPLASCDDHNSCTVDTCDINQGCVHDPKPVGTICSNEVGMAGTCQNGNPSPICIPPISIPPIGGNCNDNNPCTTDTLVNGQCVFTSNQGSFSCSSTAAFPACTPEIGHWVCLCIFGGSYPNCPTPHIDFPIPDFHF